MPYVPDESAHDGATPPGGSEKEPRPDPASEESGADRDADQDTDQDTDAAASTAGGHRVRVHVLGPPCIHGYTPSRGQALRKKSLELLVYLAVHGGSATQGAITDDVLAYALRRTVDAQLHTNVYGLRRALKEGRRRRPAPHPHREPVHARPRPRRRRPVENAGRDHPGRGGQ